MAKRTSVSLASLLSACINQAAKLIKYCADTSATDLAARVPQAFARGRTGIVLSPKLLAASESTDPDSWALLSDIHLAADRAQLGRGTNMAGHFDSVSRELLSLRKRPAAVFITGDCAFNSGETADYALLTEMLTPLRAGQMPIHLALGNHDNRERFWDALQEEKAGQRPVADRQTALVRTPRANWFILDSLETTLSTPGLLGHEQLDWLGKALDENPAKPALVLFITTRASAAIWG